MSKPSLREPFASLEAELVVTMTAGLHEWRSDLDYPQSYSDLSGCIRAVLRKFDVKLRPIPLERRDIEERDEVCPICRKNIHDTGNPELATLTTIQRFDDTRQTYAHLACVNRPKE